MREVFLAGTAGFCFGVKRAVDTVYNEISGVGNEKVYTYGPIIHNEEVVADLKAKGVTILGEDIFDSREAACLSGKVIIRSHGVGRAIYNKLNKLGLTVIDATCPFVKKIHKIVDEESAKGSRIIIVGDRLHPEVTGIIGWCNTEPIVINSVEDASKIDKIMEKNVVLVAQTTFNSIKFKELVEFFRKKDYNVCVYNTICNATHDRQEEARKLAGRVDTMIVIGGMKSSNTQKLYDMSKKECKNTYYIQTLVDLDLTVIESAKRVGITAGASTPKNIIKEVYDRMSELSFEELLKQSEENQTKIKPGSVVEGKIIDVKPDEIVVDIQYKADGIITRNEYSNTPNLDLTTVVKVGDPIKVKVIKTNDGEGQVLLSYKKVAAEKSYAMLEEAFENETVLKAKVTQVVEGGISVTVEECKVFIPASLVSDVYEKNLNKFMDQEIEFVITEFNPRKRRIIGNRKKLIVAAKAEAARKLFDSIHIGDVVEGTVKNVTSFGAFIDLGGADGLLHISEMSWGRIEDPKSILKVGDKVKTFIKDINGEKIALSLKFEDANPWVKAGEKYTVGSEVTGKVARMTAFGAFVELEPGVDALLHVSQISNEHVEKPEDVFKIGQEITAKVVDFKQEDKKISLSIKAMLKPEEDAQDEEESVEE
ncbi:MAG: bifunctional 4-hydroxy-3-methylbut-2-enyl diphosphate reductase/30S ribosomal protein S1 [Clostridium sp.]|nr:bifunctional 4-hydroxy-3-methylbut-2-enyl diphosphate reductase/30S ribosomal protein S1 [Clostridium sp.]MCM1400165.1 bifunctional 4-hydroxy-3-methylbut-2-enyl diphosphate reductase/30S ribosomal protein S1 [Clostridium sp.]MCM1460897.1 bifunctional 4-hydroxy-3-methylbut-2-enyl diphosphate reductase/30S ribosomal protein S1 [Bacteroides sp.]